MSSGGIIVQHQLSAILAIGCWQRMGHGEAQRFVERKDWCISMSNPDLDEVWELLCQCMRAKPEERPTFAEVASKVGAARQKSGGAISKWL